MCPPPSPLTPTYSRCYQPSGLSNLDIRNVLYVVLELQTEICQTICLTNLSCQTHTRFRSVAPLTPFH
ncbi:hypothetical protein M0811_14251 [Anaeramoeba ignava]|uniref:Uncharacterized protein n=1 Tax=Anaeramoeba ignava TaxID=1746090 RepID=A0A9Q0LY60_ANAIG|nr:hypothetical protein M0811_14251 [Anaeramoeba ignava]